MFCVTTTLRDALIKCYSKNDEMMKNDIILIC